MVTAAPRSARSCSSLSRDRSITVTCAPSWTNRSVIARPRPEPPPVTSADLSSNQPVTSPSQECRSLSCVVDGVAGRKQYVYFVALNSQFMCRNWCVGRRRHDRTRAQAELCEMQRTLDDALLDPPVGERVGVVSAG